MKELVIGGGYIVIVSEEWFDYLSRFKWHNSNGYALRRIKVNGRPKSIHMHRLVLGCPLTSPTNLECDHIDRVRSHNYPSNLRWTTRSENQKNRPPRGNSKYKGVQRCKGVHRGRLVYNGKYRATFKGTSRTFSNEIEAALWWDGMARAGGYEEFCLNFPKEA